MAEVDLIGVVLEVDDPVALIAPRRFGLGIEVEAIGTLSAGQPVAIGPTHQGIVAFATQNCVLASLAPQPIAALSTPQLIVAGPGIDAIIAGEAIERVRGSIAGN